MAFNERLQAAIDRAGLTAYALAQRSGVSKQSLSKLLQGTNAPSWETVQRLARALEVSYDDLADPGLAMPEEREPLPRGRPRKAEQPEALDADAGKAKGKRKG
jgi:transcriptional regulator with XRE-family HTH domain